VSEQQTGGLSALSVLDEPTRRAIFDFVRRSPVPVGRDEVSAALEIPRATAAFHLDKLGDQGLVEVEFARRGERSGPGAGRPAKFYRRSAREVSVHIPERSYDLAAELLAEAVDVAVSTGESPRDVLFRNARDFGLRVGSEYVQQQQPVEVPLARCGYEPRTDGADIALVNCPFHALAQRHTDLVCGMNLELISGMLNGMGSAQDARLAPAPDFCCVRIRNTSEK
jgi:predicted ArsR family transcriptional regulator